MNTVLGLFAAPPALGFAKQTAEAASSPFDFLLEEANKSREAATPGEATEVDQSAGVIEQLAIELQELLASLGVQPGEGVRMRTDSESGQILVDGHAAASEIERAINDNPALAANVRTAVTDSDADGSGWFDAELEATVAEEGQSAMLEWR